MEKENLKTNQGSQQKVRQNKQVLLHTMSIWIPGSQHCVAVTGIDSVNVMMVDPAFNQTIMWNAYEVSKTSQFNYFKTNW